MGPRRSVFRLGVENRVLVYQLMVEGGVSSAKAAGVVIVETFNVILNFTALTPAPPSEPNDYENSNE